MPLRTPLLPRYAERRAYPTFVRRAEVEPTLNENSRSSLPSSSAHGLRRAAVYELLESTKPQFDPAYGALYQPRKMVNLPAFLMDDQEAARPYFSQSARQPQFVSRHQAEHDGVAPYSVSALETQARTDQSAPEPSVISRELNGVVLVILCRDTYSLAVMQLQLAIQRMGGSAVAYPVFTDALGEAILQTLLAFDGILVAEDRVSARLTTTLIDRGAELLIATAEDENIRGLLQRFFGRS